LLLLVFRAGTKIATARHAKLVIVANDIDHALQHRASL
jgi:hypothetical protein